MVDRLEKEPVWPGEDRGDDIDHLGEVRDRHLSAVADEDVEVGGDGQRVREIVLFLNSTFAASRVSGPVPDVPLVVADADRVFDRLEIACTLDVRRTDSDGTLGLVGGKD